MVEESARARDVMLTALAPVVWGTTYLVATKLLPGESPLLAAVLRALPFGVLGVLVLRPRLSGVWVGRAAALSVLNVSLFFVLVFVSAYHLSGGVAATLGATLPLMVVVLAWPVLGMRPRGVDWACAVAGLAGVGLLVAGEGARISAMGVGAAMGGAACQAMAIVLARKWGPPPMTPVGMAAWQMVMGGVPLVVVWLAWEGLPAGGATWGMAAACVWLGLVATLGAFALWFRGIGRLSPAVVAGLGLLVSASAVGADMVVVGKWPTAVQWLGGVVVAAAVVGRTLVREKPAA